jgi:hypothetical protein
MRKSIAIGAGLLAGAAATAVGAVIPLPAQYFGSDTLFVVTQNAITNDVNLTGQANNYLAGGSGAGEGNMNKAVAAQALQQTAPMSRMLSNKVCTFNGGASGSTATEASGIVIGMDAVDVMASNVAGAGGSSSCTTGSSTAQTGDGLVTSGTAGVFGGGGATSQNWKWSLALLYGGLDYSLATPSVDCNGAARRALVANWSKLFQNGCSNTANGGVCSDAAHLSGAGGVASSPLWHAFRRDDASGTSDVFSSLLGLTKLYPSTSASGNNGFGASPYCNAMNWDTNVANNGGGFCALGSNDQFVGPGGIVDPASSCTFVDFQSGNVATAETCGAPGSGNHHRPPVGAWGDKPALSNFASDVLPTSFQDNDPIRRKCLNPTASKIGDPFTPGEDVCNLDGNLGLVLAVASSDFIHDQLGKVQYPATKCDGGFIVGKAPQVHSCAPFQASGPVSAHNGECPDGDGIAFGGCQTPWLSVATGNATGPTSQCLNHTAAQKGTSAHTTAYEVRAHNLFMADGTIGDGTVAAIKETIQNGSASPPVVDFNAGMGRIHSIQTVFLSGAANPPNSGCQLLDATDQISCLVQADPCSLGYAGDGGRTWHMRANGDACQRLADLGVCNGSGTPPATCTVSPAACPADSAPYSGATCPPGCLAQGGGGGGPVTDSIRVDGTYPRSETVTNLGKQAVEYQIARKLYFNSIVGFANVANTAADPGALGELELGKYESVQANITPILTGVGYFPLSNQTQTFANNPFCEDFNQRLLCTAGSNDNACARNPSGIPSDPNASAALATTSTVCGNGVQEAYEECDPGLGTAATATCSNTCRCAGATVYKSVGGVFGCNP